MEGVEEEAITTLARYGWIPDAAHRLTRINGEDEARQTIADDDEEQDSPDNAEGFDLVEGAVIEEKQRELNEQHGGAICGRRDDEVL